MLFIKIEKMNLLKSDSGWSWLRINPIPKVVIKFETTKINIGVFPAFFESASVTPVNSLHDFPNSLLYQIPATTVPAIVAVSMAIQLNSIFTMINF